MKASFNKFIAPLLFIPVLASLGTVAVFYYYDSLDKGDTANFEQIGQLRVLSDQLESDTHMLRLMNNDVHRRQVEKIIRKFDELMVKFDTDKKLAASYSNDKVLQQVRLLQLSWQESRTYLLDLVKRRANFRSEWPRWHKRYHAIGLDEDIEKLAIIFNEHEFHLHSVLGTYIKSVFVLDLFLLLFIGYSLRLYFRSQKTNSETLAGSLQEQQTISTVLTVSLSDKPLAQQLGDVLDEIFKMPNLSVNPSGCVFLVDEEKSGHLTMVAQRNLSEEICLSCDSLAYGKCLCGRAAASGETVVAAHIDQRHEISVPGMLPHGHICMPIKSSGELLGILNLYTEDGHVMTEDEENFLNIVLHGMALLIQKKQSEKKLLNSESRFRALVETSSDWLWEVDENGTYSYASPQVEQLLGYKPEEVIGKSPFDLMPPGEAEHVASVFRGFVELRNPFSLLENINRHKNGELVVLETSGVPIFDANHNFRGYRGVDRDITERKQSEEVFRVISEGIATVTGEAFFGTMVKHLGTSLGMDYVFFGEFRTHSNEVATVSVWANGKHADNFEYDLKGTPCENVKNTGLCVYPRNVQDMFPSDRLLVEMGVEGYMGTPVITSSGENIGLLAVLNREPISKQLVVSSMLQIFAVRVAAEYERVQKENQRLEEEKKQKETLVREVHHRIKNNLQGVAGLLRHHVTENQDLDSVLSVAISQIHSVAMMYGLQSDSSNEDIQLGSMINAIAENAQGLTQAMVDSLSDQELAGIEKVSSSEAVPLALVLNELIFNAIKHCTNKSDERHVRVYLQRQVDFVEVHVCNVGQLKRDFDFASGSGVGTGLTLIRSLLPKRGAALSYQELNGVVMAKLSLAEPVLKPVDDPRSAMAS